MAGPALAGHQVVTLSGLPESAGPGDLVGRPWSGFVPPGAVQLVRRTYRIPPASQRDRPTCRASRPVPSTAEADPRHRASAPDGLSEHVAAARLIRACNRGFDVQEPGQGIPDGLVEWSRADRLGVGRLRAQVPLTPPSRRRPVPPAPGRRGPGPPAAPGRAMAAHRATPADDDAPARSSRSSLHPDRAAASSQLQPGRGLATQAARLRQSRRAATLLGVPNFPPGPSLHRRSLVE